MPLLFNNTRPNANCCVLSSMFFLLFSCLLLATSLSSCTKNVQDTTEPPPTPSYVSWKMVQSTFSDSLGFNQSVLLNEKYEGATMTKDSGYYNITAGPGGQPPLFLLQIKDSLYTGSISLTPFPDPAISYFRVGWLTVKKSRSYETVVLEKYPIQCFFTLYNGAYYGTIYAAVDDAYSPQTTLQCTVNIRLPLRP